MRFWVSSHRSVSFTYYWQSFSFQSKCTWCYREHTVIQGFLLSVWDSCPAKFKEIFIQSSGRSALLGRNWRCQQLPIHALQKPAPRVPPPPLPISHPALALMAQLPQHWWHRTQMWVMSPCFNPKAHMKFIIRGFGLAFPRPGPALLSCLPCKPGISCKGGKEKSRSGRRWQGRLWQGPGKWWKKQGCGIWEKGQTDGVLFLSQERPGCRISRVQERAGLNAFCSMHRATLCPSGFKNWQWTRSFYFCIVFICCSASSHCSCPAVPLRHRPEQGKPHADFTYHPHPHPRTPLYPAFSSACTNTNPAFPAHHKLLTATLHHQDSPICNKVVK